MGLKDKYTIDKTDTSKTYLSPESFAVCEFIEELTKTIERLRGSLST